MKTLSIGEVQRLFETTQLDRTHALWVVLATTGLRLGEALGLMWNDVDLQLGKVTVRRALQWQRGVGPVWLSPRRSRAGVRSTWRGDRSLR